MTMKIEVLENQQPDARQESISGEYSIPANLDLSKANDNDIVPSSQPAPVSIRVDKVAPHEVEEFSNRPTLVAIESSIVSQRAATSGKAAKLLTSSRDVRLESDNLAENFAAMDDHAAYQNQLQREVEHHSLEQKRHQAHVDLTRKSRGFFTKIADFASNVWSGTTPEERAQGVQGVGGIKGFFSGSDALQDQMLKHAGIDPREVKPAPAVKPKSVPAAQPDVEYPLPMKKVFERKPTPPAPVTRVQDPEYPLPMKKVFEKKEKPLAPAYRDAEYPLPMNDSIVDDIKNAASKIVAGIGGFFKKLIPSKATGKKLLAVGALATGIAITGSSSCGKGCTGTHPGEPHPVASASSSGDAGSSSSAPSGVASTSPSASDSPSAVASTDPAPIPLVDLKDKDDKEKETKKAPAPKLAKVSHLPKSTSVYHPPKVAEQKKPEPPKAVELKDCQPNQVLGDADLDKCLVPGGDAEKLRVSFYSQADEQQKALDGVFAPIKNGPEYVSAAVYKRSPSSIAFLEGQGVPNDPASPNLIWQTNAANKKIVADAIVTVRAKIAAAKTPKDFYAITEHLAKIGERIDLLIAERGKQIAANMDAANMINAEYAKGKMTDIEKNTGKRINAVPLADHQNGATITKSTIDLPMTKQLLQGSEADMLAPAKGENPDKVIASVQKKIEYYRGLLQLNSDLDDVRVRQRPASARLADALRTGTSSAVRVAPGPKLTASAK